MFVHFVISNNFGIVQVVGVVRWRDRADGAVRRAVGRSRFPGAIRRAVGRSRFPGATRRAVGRLPGATRLAVGRLPGATRRAVGRCWFRDAGRGKAQRIRFPSSISHTLRRIRFRTSSRSGRSNAVVVLVAVNNREDI